MDVSAQLEREDLFFLCHVCYSSPQHVGCCPPALGKATSFPQSTESNVCLFQRHLTDTPRSHLLPAIWCAVVHAHWHITITRRHAASAGVEEVAMSIFQQHMFARVGYICVGTPSFLNSLEFNPNYAP